MTKKTITIDLTNAFQVAWQLNDSFPYDTVELGDIAGDDDEAGFEVTLKDGTRFSIWVKDLEHDD